MIDANIFLFSLWDKDQITKGVWNILEDYSSKKYISAESIKEIIHLRQSGKFSSRKQMFKGGVVDFINNETDWEIKPIKQEHLNTLEKLPILPNHKDPSDRMIIAQAITEKITLVSSDTMFPHYKKFGLEFVYNAF